MNVRKWPYYAPSPLRGGASKGADADFAPQLRDTLSRGFLILDWRRDCSRKGR